MEKTRIHYDYIDLAKGFGILLVILGHGMFPCHFAIDSFHMPLFFVLSGLTLNMPIDKWSAFWWKIWVNKKLERIMLPYIFFSVISAITEIVVGRVSPNSPFNSPLWFLQTLFVSLLLYVCASILCSKIKLNILCVGLVALTYIGYKYTDVPNVLPFGLFRAINAVVFIHIGVMLKRELQQKTSLRTYIVALFVIVLYCGSLMFTMNTYETFGANYVSGKLFSISLVWPWILSISGSVAVIYVCFILSRVRLLNWLGNNSLVIMCVHFPLTERLNVFLSSTSLSQTSFSKLILAGTELLIVLVFCYMMIAICKKYVPQFCGYKKTFLTK